MIELLFHELIYDLHKKHGELSRRIHQLEEEQEYEMSTVDTVVQELGQLKSDLATKFGEITTVINQIETEKAAGQPADLTPLKTMISELDGTVRAFDPTAAAAGGAPAGGTPTGTPEGAPTTTNPETAPGGTGTPAPDGGSAPAGGTV